uniref:Protein Hikeshi n=1 Tax=Callorhinchus milii TaxID=7868 RepID=A0A4W3K2J0_CALMI
KMEQKFVFNLQNHEDINHTVDCVPVWQLLRFITKDKPSAIFKLGVGWELPKAQSKRNSHSVAQIGISISVAGMLENIVNFAASFAITQCQIVPNLSELYIPATVVSAFLKQKYENLQRRMTHNPKFWKN